MIAKLTPFEMKLDVQDKIRNVLRDRRPLFKIEFGDRHVQIEFRITDANNALMATTASKYWLPLNVTDKTPSELWEWLQQFAVSGSL